MSSLNGRRSLRKNHGFFTVYRVLPADEETPSSRIGYTADISATGIYLYTRPVLEQGDTISLAIYPCVDGTAGIVLPKLEAEGKVLRVENGQDVHLSEGLVGVAIQFARQPAVTV